MVLADTETANYSPLYFLGPLGSRKNFARWQGWGGVGGGGGLMVGLVGGLINWE